MNTNNSTAPHQGPVQKIKDKVTHMLHPGTGTTTGTSTGGMSGLTTGMSNLSTGSRTAPMTTSSAPLSSTMGSTPLSSGMGSGMGSTPLSSGLGSGMGSTTSTSSRMGDTICTTVCQKVAPTTTAQRTVVNPTQVVQKAPVIQENVKHHTVEEIQPIVHRERVQTEIHKVVQPVMERSVMPTEVIQKTLPAEYRPEVVQPGLIDTQPRSMPQSSVFVAPTTRQVVYDTPIVEETVQRRIIEEVQPVVQREVIGQTIVKEIKPIYEKVVEAPRVIHETRAPIMQSAPTTTLVDVHESPRTAHRLSGGKFGHRGDEHVTPLSGSTASTTSSTTTTEQPHGLKKLFHRHHTTDQSSPMH